VSRPIERGPATEKQVAFAVTVVWGTEYVRPIADAFRRDGSRATFFLGGEWAQAHPREARFLRDLDMEIASHGDRHRHVGHLSLEENLVEIDRAGAAIEAASGVRPRLYAPAYGEISPEVLRAAQLRHLPVILWTIDTIDWRTSMDPGTIRERVLSRLEPGAIILMHPTDRTLQALPGLLADVKARGYRTVTVSRLLGLPAASDSDRKGVRAGPGTHAAQAGAVLGRAEEGVAAAPRVSAAGAP
jgi:peptidoglycan/xylan/chitin deacetylase (PgdA/CDA1 family)